MILIVDLGSLKTPKIVEVVSKLGYNNLVINEPDFTSAILGEDVTGVILSGSPVLLTEIDCSPYLTKFDILKRINIPILGICFGHQLLGILFGAKIFRGVENREITTIYPVNNSILFADLPNPFTMQQDHKEGIELPPDFKHLAYSDDFKIEAMEHLTKRVFGVQFHPEVSGKNGEVLIANFLQFTFK